MSKSKMITLRIQSSEGTKRINVSSNDPSRSLYEKVHDAFSLSGYMFTLFKERNNKDEIISSRSKTISSYGLCHGDMVYLSPLNGAVLWEEPQPGTSSSIYAVPSTSKIQNENETNGGFSSTSSSTKQNTSVVEDEVDQILWKLDGKVKRNRDQKLCRHGGNASCVHCSPLDCFDDAYLKEQNIKHMSFHTYLRKLTAGVDRGKFVSLEDISCKIKPGCLKHPPWPQGICSKCQPNVVTLNRQAYRHIDNVMFENAHLVERFLEYWRTTGHQRIGYLYGRYEPHSDVPLGIRASVAAIYEPPQETTRDRIKLLPDDKESIVNDIAKELGLCKVGWIFTDLLADNLQKGTVKHTRSIDSHFLTAQECIMAGHFQNKHPNPCRFSPSGFFGSKFVTICVTGDSSNQVHMEGYSVSNQCMALVRDDCLVPTKDAPELGYVREPSDKQYVPDVFYKEKDNYGNEVTRLARPLPVEYLLVDVPASTPITPIYTFYTDNNIRPFPVENRMVDGHIQDFSALAAYLSQFTSDQFLSAVSDFHLLIHVATMNMLPMQGFIGPLLTAVRNHHKESALEWARSEPWVTVEQLIVASRDTGAGSVASPQGGSVMGEEWTCPYCTFLNPSNINTCDMCNLPR
uniref:Nuclear protein localization protein 4 homolog n=2 Tax=Clastoptera arizonana TaxID=38151 RepID=A0A1B6CST9_9HEMI